MDDAGPQALNTGLGILKDIPSENIPTIVGLFAAMRLCLVISSICAASENAFFSHKENDLEENSSDDNNSKSKQSV